MTWHTHKHVSKKTTKKTTAHTHKSTRARHARVAHVHVSHFGGTLQLPFATQSAASITGSGSGSGMSRVRVFK